MRFSHPSGRLFALIFTLVLGLVGLADTGLASFDFVNSWTNPASARWEDAYWSLGKLPATNQDIYVTNGGFKAVGIFDTTVAAHADSLTISNLAISAPASALSTVLLNYTGLGTPLKILNGCVIGTNGTLQNEYGSLEIDGAGGGMLTITDHGRLVQEGGQTTASVPVLLDNGTIACTNGNMTLGEVRIGASTGASLGSMTQDGGSIAAQDIGINDGSYTLVNGLLYSISGTSLVLGSSGFYQYGGTNFGDVNASGLYDLKGGLAQGNVAGAGSPGQILVRGGTLSMAYINVGSSGSNWPGGGPLLLQSGGVRCGTLIRLHPNLGTLEQFADRDLLPAVAAILSKYVRYSL